MEILESNMEILENIKSSGVNLHRFMPISGDNFLNHDYHHPHGDHTYRFNFIGDHQSGSVYDPTNLFPSTMEVFGFQHDGVATTVESFMNSDPPGLFRENNKGYVSKKRKKNNESGVEKPRDVVHVRAKRGEATNSHSLAERVRREKINEKLRRLQDLVPGCYKTMGMAVMLDVIINYVRSLQNQIEFLSMKLQVASVFYDFNSSETVDTLDIMKGTNLHEIQVLERMVGEGYGDLPRF